MAREKGGFWVGLTAVFFYPLTWLCGRWRVEGLDRIPRSGPALIVANHISYLDPVYTAVFVHRGKRVPRFLAKDSIWRLPVMKWIMPGSGQIPVYRDSADAQRSLSAGIEALEDGKMVIIYPEGTITRDPDQWPMQSRTGVARLALSGDVPVIPLVHWGTLDVFDMYQKKFRPLPRKEIVVRCGDPIDLSAYRGRPVDAALLREVTDHMMGVVRDLLAEVRGEPAPAGFYRKGRAGRPAAPEGPVDGSPDGSASGLTDGSAGGSEASAGGSPDGSTDGSAGGSTGRSASGSAGGEAAS
ncbi:lysophospholipid acyltransferase family protein [Pseudonocardia eucalypti]|uniref:Lysophospholipid acyltransferase family protein n=1 Tax=Pseudonocardia eucalypti TaxID=648755 RepID=A0ABP9QA89_9PSEU|nr:1-acyl-sn-glycerol-3-phosphate acyltransferase [Pseudonocardia eucalypti]